MMTEFGGAVAVPIAVRSSDSTTTMRVNDVIMIRIDGAIESTVRSAINWIARSVTPPWPPPRLMLMSWAAAGVASATAAIRKVRTKKTLRGLFGILTKTTTSDGRAGRPSRLRGSQSWSWQAQEQAAGLARRGPCEPVAVRAQPAALRSRVLQRAGAVRPRDAAPSRRGSGPPSAAVEALEAV